MTMETMDCPAPEHGLIPFLAAGTLEESERAAAAAHARDCPVCAAELEEVRTLLDGLRSTHLTADEIVEVAESGAAVAHLDVCPACRAERDTLREVNASLARAQLRPSPWRRPELAWAAALVLTVPAALYVLGAARRGTPDGPDVERGAEPVARVAVAPLVVLSASQPTAVPSAMVVVEFAMPARGPGERIEAELVDGRGATLWAGTLGDDVDRGRLALDARDLDAATLELRRVDAAGRERERLAYTITSTTAR